MSHNAWHNARTMYEQDACAQALGIDIIDMDDGYAVVTMTITPQMLNGHKTCHGGQLFSPHKHSVHWLLKQVDCNFV